LAVFVFLVLKDRACGAAMPAGLAAALAKRRRRGHIGLGPPTIARKLA
jgi:hypothetical protein